MADVKKWRIENYNIEKRPRKFNSWVANRPFKEFQSDLFFFNDLRQREKLPTGKAKEPVDYAAGLLVVDTFSKKIAIVPIEGRTRTTKAPLSQGHSGRWEASRKCYTPTRSPG